MPQARRCGLTRPLETLAGLLTACCSEAAEAVPEGRPVFRLFGGGRKRRTCRMWAGSGMPTARPRSLCW